jgi:short-subunit dehydrogenase
MNILITGSSTGIGFSCVKSFAQNGHFVLAGVRSEEDFQRFDFLNKPSTDKKKKSKTKRGSEVKSSPFGTSESGLIYVKPIILDVTNKEHISNLVQYLKENNIKIDILINNAGVALLGPLVEIDEGLLEKQFDINVLGVFRMTKALFPFLRETKGRIINIGSTSGLHAYPFEGPYAMSKHALEAYSDSLRREISSFGVKVILIEPSKVKTEIWSKSEEAFEALKNSEFKDKAERLLRKSLVDNEKKGLESDKVGDMIYKIAMSKDPNPRYLLSKHRFLSWLTNAIPDRWMDKLVEKY